MGGHPEYCAPLHLDHDDDEVHESVAAGKDCEYKAEASIRFNTLSKFSRN